MKLRNTLVAASLALGAMGSAYADSFASAILDINNFRLLHSSGVPFSTADFDTLTGTNDAHATASLNGVFANGAQSFGILSGLNPDVPHQCVGVPCPAKPENDFTPFPFPPPAPGTFGYADQQLTGSTITIGMAPAGARATTRADASLQVDGVASGNSDVGTSTTFSFTLAAADTMTFSFDGTPFTQAWVDAAASPTTNANARLSWSVNIIDTATGTTVFSYAPAELNALSNVSRTDGAPGTSTYNPGTLAFSATTPLLSADVVYQITIQHNTLANALQQRVPEPASLAIFGIGLLGMTAVARRRKS
ncbi:EDSAP-1 family PEP-CTERM protein [Pseudoduganella sp. GCM10020061]|uniref:EDSAP-1 family PEP-CTERM protein n=1 Tax=Pseudoduganella sp. GCM10020061 TaxID=3317345 RepID=UPI00362AD431